MHNSLDSEALKTEMSRENSKSESALLQFICSLITESKNVKLSV